MVEQWNTTQYTQNPGHYASPGGYVPSASMPAHFDGSTGHVVVDNGAAAYPYGDPSSGFFQPRVTDNLPATRFNDLDHLGHPQGGYPQVPGSQSQPRMGNNQGAYYPAVTSSRFGVPMTAIPPGFGGAGVPGGGYFGPGAESTTVPQSSSSNATAIFGDEPNYWEIPVTADGKRYHCECGHETKTAGDMARHHQTSKHSGANYTCPCGKRYFRKDGLTRHEKSCQAYTKRSM